MKKKTQISVPWQQTLVTVIPTSPSGIITARLEGVSGLSLEAVAGMITGEISTSV